MTQLDERNGWHVVAEGDLPDTARDVWIAGSGGIALSPAYYRKGGWCRIFEGTIHRIVLLWHEIERPEIPEALRDSMEER